MDGGSSAESDKEEECAFISVLFVMVYRSPGKNVTERVSVLIPRFSRVVPGGIDTVAATYIHGGSADDDSLGALLGVLTVRAEPDFTMLKDSELVS